MSNFVEIKLIGFDVYFIFFFKLIDNSFDAKKKKIVEKENRKCFLDFVGGLLKLDPTERWTADQAIGLT